MLTEFVKNVKKKKMEYKEIEGDLLQMCNEGMFDYIAHGCNCHKFMGAGIAKKISQEFPDAFLADNQDKRLPTERLGDFTCSLRYYGTTVIINLYTQYHPGKNLDYEALTLSLRKVNMLFPNTTIGLPKIGCGIAGGDWKRVKEIIKRELRDMKSVTVVIYKEKE